MIEFGMEKMAKRLRVTGNLLPNVVKCFASHKLDRLLNRVFHYESYFGRENCRVG